MTFTTIAEIIEARQPEVWQVLCVRYLHRKRGKLIELKATPREQSEPVGGKLAANL